MLPQRGGHDRAFWTGGAQGQLLIARCDECAHWVHPPAATCRDCGGTLVARPVSGRGTVFTYTVNLHAYNPAVPTPYVIAIVELAEQHGLRLATNIVDCEPDSVVCGMRVEVQFEQHGAGADAVFVPVFAPEGRATGAAFPSA
ncbi:MAG: Zn-ribbon domain-containing OB-fold protein [Mycobacterium sp.]